MKVDSDFFLKLFVEHFKYISSSERVLRKLGNVKFREECYVIFLFTFGDGGLSSLSPLKQLEEERKKKLK